MCAAASIPSKFLGTFKLHKDEKFDEYLASKGVPWPIRKMICFTSLTKVIEKSSGQEGGYNLLNQSFKDNTAYNNWQLGKSFESKGFDGKQHRVWPVDSSASGEE